jgi:hypothetical protein
MIFVTVLSDFRSGKTLIVAMPVSFCPEGGSLSNQAIPPKPAIKRLTLVQALLRCSFT